MPNDFVNIETLYSYEELKVSNKEFHSLDDVFICLVRKQSGVIFLQNFYNR